MSYQAPAHQLVILTLQEGSARAKKKPQGMFDTHLARMQEYDGEVCPERWSPALEEVKSNGWDHVKLLHEHGERHFFHPIKDIRRFVKSYNKIQRAAAQLKREVSIEDYQLKVRDIYYDENRSLEKSETGTIFKVDRNSINHPDFLMTLDDHVKGFSLLYTLGEKGEYTDHAKVKLWGIPKCMGGRVMWDSERVALELGELTLDDLFAVGYSRFIYAFASPPAGNEEIIDALVEINYFPKNDDEGKIKYQIKEADIKMNMPSNVSVALDEALRARDQGLFKDVQVFKLEGPKKITDPVLIGIDHFGQMFPILYWAGDEL